MSMSRDASRITSRTASRLRALIAPRYSAMALEEVNWNLFTYAACKKR